MAQRPDAARPRVALAGRSVRALAEAAWRDGFEPLALDLFGDLDTRRVSPFWRAIGDAATLRLDTAALCDGLRHAAAQGAVGWVAGSGFDGDAGALAAGAACLPLMGTAPERQRAVRDPAAFFGLLDGHRLPHPAVWFAAADAGPADPGPWLLKQAGGCGGEQVRRWTPAGKAPPAGHYLQRLAPGAPMSATFVADGRGARVLGFNRQLLRGSGALEWLFAGALGPVPLPAAAEATVRRALAALVPAFGLVGLGSLDFLCDGEAVALLEVNARPPATLALYPQHAPFAAHLAACGRAVAPTSVLASVAGPVSGFRHVFARRDAQVSAALAGAIAALPHTHDLPQPGSPLAAGAPVCTVSATADTEAATLALLARGSGRVLHLLETSAP